jgi:hypothetical protein
MLRIRHVGVACVALLVSCGLSTEGTAIVDGGSGLSNDSGTPTDAHAKAEAASDAQGGADGPTDGSPAPDAADAAGVADVVDSADAHVDAPGDASQVDTGCVPKACSPTPPPGFTFVAFATNALTQCPSSFVTQDALENPTTIGNACSCSPTLALSPPALEAPSHSRTVRGAP